VSRARSIARAVAVHKVLAEMASLPDELGIRCESSFELLDDVLVATVLEDRLLRALFIDFVKGGEEMVQVAASIDWRRKTLATQGDDDDELIDLDDDEDFEESLMRKLRVFRSNVAKLAKRHKVESAEWSIILIDEGEKRARSNAVRKRFDITTVPKSYLDRIKRFEQELTRSGGVKGSWGDKRVDGLGLVARSRRISRE
jgi:hypothetical protein